MVLFVLDDSKWCNYGLKTPNLWPAASGPSEDKGNFCVSSMSDERFVAILWQDWGERREDGMEGLGEPVGVGVSCLRSVHDLYVGSSAELNPAAAARL